MNIYLTMFLFHFCVSSSTSFHVKDSLPNTKKQMDNIKWNQTRILLLKSFIDKV